MSTNVTVSVQGKPEPQPAVILEIVKKNEPIQEYELEDGTVIKMKNLLNQVTRLEGEIDANGNKKYLFNGQTSFEIIEKKND